MLSFISFIKVHYTFYHFYHFKYRLLSDIVSICFLKNIRAFICYSIHLHHLPPNCSQSWRLHFTAFNIGFFPSSKLLMLSHASEYFSENREQIISKKISYFNQILCGATPRRSTPIRTGCSHFSSLSSRVESSRVDAMRCEAMRCDSAIPC